MESKTLGREPVFSEMLVRSIDDIVARESEEREKLTGEYMGMMLEPLRKGGVAIESLEHLKVSFLDSDKRLNMDEIKINENTPLGRIQKDVLDRFGSEVFRRISLQLVEEKVNRFGLKQK
jgi:hypothetical protein